MKNKGALYALNEMFFHMSNKTLLQWMEQILGTNQVTWFCKW